MLVQVLIATTPSRQVTGSSPARGAKATVVNAIDPRSAQAIIDRAKPLPGAHHDLQDGRLAPARECHGFLMTDQSSGRAAKSFFVFIYHFIPDTGCFHLSCMLVRAL